MEEKICTLNKWMEECNKIVFFGGAGVSTESGIPDFRSVDGLYSMKYQYPPETILSHTFFMKYMLEFYKFYFDRMIYLEAQPNACHKKLYELEQKEKLACIITQNIDGLHQKAGNTEVYELHGSILRNYCVKCKQYYDVTYMLNHKPIPKCHCGGIIKPDVVLYEEPLDDTTVNSAIWHIQQADMLIVGGTSLNVYPAAGLIHYFQGKYLVLINKEATSYDKEANLIINGKIGEIFTKLK